MALGNYLKKFGKLRIDRSHGVAPHKPVLLLSLLQAVRTGVINSNKIHITPELISLFKSNWSNLVSSNHFCRFALPFFHLRSEKFWLLVAKPGCESILHLSTSVSSISGLDNLIEYAVIDQELFELMNEEKENLILQHFLLMKYFNGLDVQVNDVIEKSTLLLEEAENKILNESPEEYISEISKLLAQKNEEEVFFRGSVFKREIPKAYNNTCCISGLRIESISSISMLDACHIRPFSLSHDDTIKNGISLCPNLHRAFDRGVISIDSNYKVSVSSVFTENENPYSIRQFQNREILLPNNRKYWPDINNLEWHRNNVFKG